MIIPRKSRNFIRKIMGLFEEYKNLVGVIGQTISYYPQQLNASRAILLISWMSGKPLSYLIRKSYESYLRKNYSKKLPEVIREVMDNVESFVRYQFAKDSGSRVGRIKTATQGLFSITDVNEAMPEKKIVRVVNTVEYFLTD